MGWIQATDDRLEALIGEDVPSEVFPDVRYRVRRRLGEGGSGVAFLASRIAPEGQCATVLKLVRPSLVREDPQAPLFVRKEAVALGRLNERVPPTPFVVRLIDTGALFGEHQGRRLELPWLAVEYVHGGIEGATLGDRIEWSIETTGCSFEPERAALAVECLAQALTAVHEVGVIHRDVKPDNVLCCGFGDDELFKLSDFGIARPTGMAATFGSSLFGTPGYASPEMLGSDPASISPASDVFGLAAVIYYLLAGEHYFDISSAHAHLMAISERGRRSVLDSRYLHPELRKREVDCRTIDTVLAQATGLDADARPSSAQALAGSLLHLLRGGSDRAAPSTARPSGMAKTSRSNRIGRLASQAPQLGADHWSWTIRRQPGYGRTLIRAAWGGDGRCLAVADGGLIFWDGTTWRDAVHPELPPTLRASFLHRAGPGLWIVGAEQTVLGYSSTGVAEVLGNLDSSVSYQLFSGDLHDLCVFVSLGPRGTTALRARAGGWWLRPLSLPQGTAIRALARVDSTLWLVVGDDEQDRPFAAIYAPLEWQFERLSFPRPEGLRACGGHSDRRAGCAAGVAGSTLWWEEGRLALETIHGARLLTTVAVDAVGRGWAAEAGRIWMRPPHGAPGHHAHDESAWRIAWEQPTWTAPMISLYADVGLVLALTADGSIVEGRRIEPTTLVSRPP